MALSSLRCCVVLVIGDERLDAFRLFLDFALPAEAFDDRSLSDDDVGEIAVDEVFALFIPLLIIDLSFIRDGGDDAFVDALCPGEDAEPTRTTRLVLGDAGLVFFFFFLFPSLSFAAIAAFTAPTKPFTAALWTR